MNKITADLIIWDLDGTLIDSKKDIADALNETLMAVDLAPLDVNLIYSYVGNGVRPLLVRAMTTAGRMDELDEAIKQFQSIYPRRLLDNTVMFAGIEEILEEYQTKGKKMAVASNKPVRYVEKILDGLNMNRFFVSVKGGDSYKTNKPEPEMLSAILGEAGLPASSAVIIGDSAVDIEAGKNVQVRTVGVTYGFRPRQEVVDSKPDALCDAPADIPVVVE